MLTKHFVVYSFPGSLFSETTSQEIDSWDPDKAKAKAPKGAFSFQFITKGRRDDELDSKIIDRSGNYYLGGTLYTLDDVEQGKMPGSTDILLTNMRGNGWNTVIKTPRGNVQPFTNKDRLV